MEELETILKGLTNVESFGAGCIVGGTITFVVSMAILVAILEIIALWKDFEKAGEKGWKSIIPVYNVFILFRIIGIKEWWFWTLLCGSFISGIMTSGTNVRLVSAGNDLKYVLEGYDNPAAIIGTILIGLIGIVTTIWVARNGAKAFGKGTGFAVCLFFFPNICWLILGLGKSKYHKKAIEE